MPNVANLLDMTNNINKKCDACCKAKATYFVAPIAGLTKRNLFFCDNCMKRNTHLLFNAGREYEKFSATAQRRKNNDDLPDLTMPASKNSLKGFGTIE
jgi:hypothetical protein